MKCNLSGLMPDFLKSSTAIHIAGLTLVFLLIVGAILVNAQANSDKPTLSDPTKTVPVMISIIALVFSAYTLFRQKFAAETSSWNTALMRVGQLYDQAVQNDDLARLIREPVDRDGSQAYHLPHLSRKQDMWLANLFMAFEQIYVAISGASRESQRAWKQFLSNQLNKPTIRAVFLRDAQQFSDYHQAFFRFVCGQATKGPNGVQFSGGAIKKDVINKTLSRALSKTVEPPDVHDLEIHQVSKVDLPFLRNLYSDPEVKRQMYAVPSDTDEDLLDYFHQQGKAAAFTVTISGEPVAGFTIRKENQTQGTFGMVIHKRYRGRRFGLPIMKTLEARAKEMGILTLRADVYSDNIPSIRLLERVGFREFVWFEKNLD